MRLKSLILAIAAGVAPASDLWGQLGLALSPMRLELRFPKGGQHTGVLTLTNDSNARIRIRAEVLDFFIDAAATPQFGREFKQEQEYSCKQWLTLNPMELELGAGVQRGIRYTLRVPAEASESSYHCAAGFSTLPSPAQKQGVGIATAVRIISAFYAIAGKPEVQGELRDMKIEYVPDAKTPVWRAVVSVENLGLMYFRPIGELALLSAEGKVLESMEFQPLPVLPKRKQRFLFVLKGPIHAGTEYKLRARIDIGGPELQEGTVSAKAELPTP